MLTCRALLDSLGQLREAVSWTMLRTVLRRGLEIPRQLRAASSHSENTNAFIKEVRTRATDASGYLEHCPHIAHTAQYVTSLRVCILMLRLLIRTLVKITDLQ